MDLLTQSHAEALLRAIKKQFKIRSLDGGSYFAEGVYTFEVTGRPIVFYWDDFSGGVIKGKTVGDIDYEFAESIVEFLAKKYGFKRSKDFKA
ncbi:MAG: hypothetical protein ACFBZ9_09525 [Sphingomonadales bacterium]